MTAEQRTGRRRHSRRRRALSPLTGILLCVSLITGALALVLGGTAFADGGPWGTASTGVAPSGAAADPAEVLQAIACESPGNCIAFGDYTDSSSDVQGTVQTELTGSLTSGVEAALPGDAAANPSVSFASATCPSSSVCLAIGTYSNSSGATVPFVETDSSGSLSASAVPLPADAASNPSAVVSEIACPAVGTCAAVGSYVNQSAATVALLMSLSSGSWSSATLAMPSGANSNPNVTVSGVSCGSTTNCSAAGDYDDTSDDLQGFTIDETSISSNTWSAAAELTLPSDAATDPNVQLRSVSCSSPLVCAAVGSYEDTSNHPEGLELNRTSSGWGSGVTATQPSNSNDAVNQINSVSCPGDAGCTAVGYYQDSSGSFQPFEMEENSIASWGSESEIAAPSNAAGNGAAVTPTLVSCSSVGDCGMFGTYADTGPSVEGMVDLSSGGSWSQLSEVTLPSPAGDPALTASAIACSAAATCSAVGAFVDSSGNHEGFMATSALTAQTISFNSTSTNPPVGSTYTPSATGGGSGNPVTFTIDSSTASVCSITGGTVDFNAIGTCILDANQAGNSDYSVANQVQQTIDVLQGTQTISFTSPAPTAPAVGTTYTAIASGGSSGNPVTFSIDASSTSGACSISGPTVTMVSLGNCIVDANQAGDTNYQTATQAQQSFDTTPANGSVFFDDQTLGLYMHAPAGSNQRVSYFGRGVAVDANGDLWGGTAGSSVDYVPAGDATPGTPTAISPGVSSAKGPSVDNAGDLVIADSASGIVKKVPYGGSSSTLVSSGLGTSVRFTAITKDGSTVYISDTSANTVWEIPYSGGSLTPVATTGFTLSGPEGLALDGAGDLFIADSGNNRIIEVPVSGAPFVVSTGSVTLDAPLGLATDAAGDLYVDNSGTGAVYEIPPGGGTPTAPFTGGVFVYGVAVMSQPPTWTTDTPPVAATANSAYGGYTYQANDPNGVSAHYEVASGSLPAGLTLDSSTGALSGTTTTSGTSTFTVRAYDGANFVSSASTSINVAAVAQSASFTSSAPSSPVVGDTYTVTASATSGLSPTLSIDASTTASACSLLGSTVSFDHPGSCVIDANQAGNGIYSPATQVQQTIIVGKDTPEVSWAIAGATTVTAQSDAYPDTSTGVTLSSGQMVTVTDTGTWSSGNPYPLVDGNGVPGVYFNGVYASNCELDPTAYGGALVGSLDGGSTWFLIGDGPTVVTGPGTLVLANNDCPPAGDFTDNSGSLNVTLTPTITYGTALTSGFLDASTTVTGTFTYNPPLGSVVSAGVHSLGVTFTPTDTTDDNTTTGSASIDVLQAPLSITASSPNILYGAAPPAVTPVYSGFVNSESASSLTTAPSCSTTATASSVVGHYVASCSGAVDANYAITYAAGQVTVNQATPSITWATPAAVSYGSALDATELDASASVPGTFVYTPALGSVPAAGSDTLQVAFTPTDAVDYTTASATVSLSVGQLLQHIIYASSPNPNAQLSTQVAAGSQPFGVALSSDGSTAYIANRGDNTLSVVNTATKAISATVAVGLSPFSVAVSPDGHTAYVTDYGSGTVSVVTNGVLTATVAVGAHPYGIAISPDGSSVYVANSGSNTVSVIATATHTVTSTLTVGSAPVGVAVSPDGNTLYVSAQGGTPSLDVVKVATGSTTAAVSLGGVPFGIAVAPDGSSVYVANQQLNEVQVVATSSNTLSGVVTGVTAASAVAIAPDGSYGYVADYTAGTVTTFSTATLATYSAVSVGGNPFAIAVSPDGLSAWVANYGASVTDVLAAGSVQVGGSFAENPSGGSSGNAVALSVGSATTNSACSVTVDEVTFAHVGVCDILAKQLGDTNYTSSQVDQEFPVTKGSPALAWASPSPIVYGTALSSAQLDATAGVAGTFTYSPLAGTVLAAGTQSLGVTFTPTDSADYDSSNLTVSISVAQGSQSVNFTTSPPTALYGGSYTPAATVTAATAVLPVFSIDAASDAGVCSLSGGVVHFTGVGTCVVDATAPGTSSLLQSVSSQRIAVAAVPLTVSASSVTFTYGGTAPSVVPSYSGFVGSEGTSALTTLPTCIADVGATSAVGSYSTTCSGGVSSHYSFNYVAGTATVTAAPTIVTWSPPSGITYGTTLSSAQLDATASVPGAFAYSPALGAQPPVGSDTLSVTFTPTDSTDFSSVTKTVTLSVAKATPTLNWSQPSGITYGTALSSTQLNATASTSGSISYQPAAGQLPPAGTDTLTATFTASDPADYSTVTKTISIAVAKALPAVTWTPPTAITYGTALSATQLDAASPVPGSFVYSPALGATPAAGNGTLSVTFTPSSSSDYLPAVATVTLQVTQATPTITWPTPAAITEGTALSATQLDASASVPGSFTYSPAAGATPAAGSDPLSVSFTPTDTTDYATATSTVNLEVDAASPGTTTTTTTTLPGSTGSTGTTLPPAPPGTVVIDIAGQPGLSIGNGHVHVHGRGFKPGSTVTIVAHSTPLQLGTASVGQNGNFATSVGMPASLQAGPHHIVVSGELNNGALVAQTEAFTVATGGVLGTVGSVPPGPLASDVAFVPSAHKSSVLATTAGTTAALGAVSSALGGGMGGTGGGGSGGRGSGGGGSGGGYLEDVELERMDLAVRGGSRGDRSRSWRWPGTAKIDHFSKHYPAKIAALSPVAGRVLVDGDYLRAMFGAGWLLLCVLAFALGLVASASNGWYAVPPAIGIFLGVLGLSIFDSTLGYLAGIAFFGSALLAGHVTSAAEIRDGAGVVLLWFAVPLAAAALRPLRRNLHFSLGGLWERSTDFVIGGLFAAWAAQKMTGALAGLAGVDLPIEKYINLIAFSVLGFVGIRVAIETFAAHYYPGRLEKVKHRGELESENLQVGLSLIIQIALFIFISISFIGSTWPLYVGAAVFFSPLIPWLVADKIPKSEFVTKWKPKGLVNWFLIIVIGVGLSRLLDHVIHDAKLAEALGFILLPLPVLISWALELFETGGEEEEEEEEDEDEEEEHEQREDTAHDAEDHPGEGGEVRVPVLVGSVEGAGESEGAAHHVVEEAAEYLESESARSRFREQEVRRREERVEHRAATPWKVWGRRFAGIPLVVVCVYLVVTHIAGG